MPCMEAAGRCLVSAHRSAGDAVKTTAEMFFLITLSAVGQDSQTTLKGKGTTANKQTYSTASINWEFTVEQRIFRWSTVSLSHVREAKLCAVSPLLITDNVSYTLNISIESSNPLIRLIGHETIRAKEDSHKWCCNRAILQETCRNVLKVSEGKMLILKTCVYLQQSSYAVAYKALPELCFWTIGLN